MPYSIPFLLDEHVDPAVATGLRRRGIDVTTTLDVGLSGATDGEHLDYGLRTGRVIFTSDRDFLRLHATGRRHAGIVYTHPERAKIGVVIRRLAQIWEWFDADDFADRVEYL